MLTFLTTSSSDVFTARLYKNFPVRGGWVREAGNMTQTQPARADSWLSLAKIIAEIVATYPVASRLSYGDRLQCRPLVPITLHPKRQRNQSYSTDPTSIF